MSKLSQTSSDAKRKASDGDISMEDAGDEGTQKRSKADSNDDGGRVSTAPESTDDPVLQGAKAAALFIPFLSPDDLLPPKLPTKEQLEGILLGLRKKALVEEYFGE